jgi:hypothetical protein
LVHLLYFSSSYLSPLLMVISISLKFLYSSYREYTNPETVLQIFVSWIVWCGTLSMVPCNYQRHEPSVLIPAMFVFFKIKTALKIILIILGDSSQVPGWNHFLLQSLWLKQGQLTEDVVTHCCSTMFWFCPSVPILICFSCIREPLFV